MTTNESRTAVRVCEIADIECSRNCGTGACKREMTTEKNRADALTDEQIVCLTKQVTGWQTHGWIPSEPLGHFYAGPHHQAPVDSVIRIVRACLLTASPVEQPAAAQIDPPRYTQADMERYGKAYADARDARRVAPAPADERAAFERNVPLHELWADAAALCHRVQQGSLLPDDLAAHIRKKIDAVIGQGSAASASETGAEGSTERDLSRTIDERDRMEEDGTRLAEAVGEFLGVDVGEWSSANNPIVSAIEALESRSPAMAAEAVGIVHRPAPNGDHFSVEWLSPPAAGKLYAATQPAQADARVGLTDEQRSDIHAAIRAIAEYSDEIKASNVTVSGTWCDAYEEQAYESYVALLTRLRALLAARPGQPEPIAWESTTVAYTKYITDERYQKFSPEVRKWYRPYRCWTCTEPRAEVTDKGDAE